MNKDQRTIMAFLSAPYRDGARGKDGCYDCWGMTRSARSALYGLPLLPEFSTIDRTSPMAFNKWYGKIAERSKVCQPKPGSVAAVMSGKLCTHVALVTHDVNSTGLGLHVLETNPNIGAQFVPLQRFLENHYNRTVIFYEC